ncbi:hypothetical protein RJ639_001953 [Escallonia herrerae]|uniref:ACT domain-containing protein ACR n=1 Tax=Escallonia herrerae TaxID=1293975 RepID=A0AA89BP17_9ASTE|nr:hypothetical protein RJ639_001953 [Escallonia herrerae]
MNPVSSPYFDPEFDSLAERIYGPTCKVSIDNESLEDCTMVKIDSVNKQGLLLEVVQVLTDMNLTISKGYISSDAGWFMDVFHVNDERGNKITEQRVINYIKKALCANTATTSKVMARTNKLSEFEPTAIEMTGEDRPGLFSEISAALADLHCNIVEAHAWSHNARLACVARISDQSSDTPIDDRRLASIEDHLTTVLHATTARKDYTNDQEVKTAGLPEGDGTMTTVERRLHQLMLSVRDFDGPARPLSSWMIPIGSDSDDEERKTSHVEVESCDEKGYSIVTVQCKDRRRLMFDTVCTLTDMQYAIFHASVYSHEGYAFQRNTNHAIYECHTYIKNLSSYYCGIELKLYPAFVGSILARKHDLSISEHLSAALIILPKHGVLHTAHRRMRLEHRRREGASCLEAAIERRVCEGIRLELCADDRVGLLSDITRVLRENGLVVVRADVATRGEKAVNAFYVREISGNNIHMAEFVESFKREMSLIDLAIKDETVVSRPSSPEKSRFSIGDMLKSQIERFSHNFVTIK